jgi:hypothetical protein
MTSLRWIQSLIAFGEDGKYTITYDPYTSRWVCGSENDNAFGEIVSTLSGRKTLAEAMEWCEDKEGSNDSNDL